MSRFLDVVFYRIMPVGLLLITLLMMYVNNNYFKVDYILNIVIALMFWYCHPIVDRKLERELKIIEAKKNADIEVAKELRLS